MNQKIGKYGFNFRCSKLLDFRRKWPEIVTNLKNLTFKKKNVSLPA
jgi:hypothetical protein